MDEGPKGNRPQSLPEQEQIDLVRKMGGLLHQSNNPSKKHIRAKWLEKAIDLLTTYPGSNILAMQVGFYLLETRKLEEAKHYFDMAYAVDTDHIRTLEGLARCEWFEYVKEKRDGHHSEANTHLQRAEEFIDRSCNAIISDKLDKPGAPGFPSVIMKARIVLEKGKNAGRLQEALEEAREYAQVAEKIVWRGDKQLLQLSSAMDDIGRNPDPVYAVKKLAELDYFLGLFGLTGSAIKRERPRVLNSRLGMIGRFG